MKHLQKKLFSFITSCILMAPTLIHGGVGTWSPAVEIGSKTGFTVTTQFASIAINSSNQAVAGWKFDNGYSNFFNGTSWGTQGALVGTDSLSANFYFVGISDVNSAILCFTGVADLKPYVSTTTIGTPFTSDITLSTTGNYTSQGLAQTAMDLSGRNVVVWYRFTNAGDAAMMGSFAQNTASVGTANNTVISSTVGVPIAIPNQWSFVSMSPNTGNIAAAYVLNPGATSQVEVVTNINGVWNTPTTFPSVGNSTDACAAINDTGHIILAWRDGVSGLVSASVFNGSSWGSATQIAPTTATSGTLSVVIDDYGNGLAGFTSTGGVATMIPFTSNTWITPIAVSPAGQTAFRFRIAMNSNGQAVGIWILNQATPTLAKVQAISYYDGVVTNYPNLFDMSGTTTTAGFTPMVAINNNQFAMATFRYIDNGGLTTHVLSSNIQLILGAPRSPSNLTASLSLNKFGTVTDRVKVLSWQASPTPGVLFYNIYQNGVLIGQTSASGPLVFNAHDSPKTPQTFSVASVAAQGEGASVSIVF